MKIAEALRLPMRLRVREILNAAPVDEVYSSRELAVMLGTSRQAVSVCASDGSWGDLSKYTLIMESRQAIKARRYGNPKAIKELRKKLQTL
jgi:hypothetical protein